jgi:hypothetical protein
MDSADGAGDGRLVGRRGKKYFVLPVHAVNTVDADDAIRSIGIDGGDTTRAHCARVASPSISQY